MSTDDEEEESVFFDAIDTGPSHFVPKSDENDQLTKNNVVGGLFEDETKIQSATSIKASENKKDFIKKSATTSNTSKQINFQLDNVSDKYPDSVSQKLALDKVSLTGSADTITDIISEKSTTLKPSEDTSTLLDFEIALIEITGAVENFFSNRILDAYYLIESKSHLSLYHSTCNGLFKLINAMLTYDTENIQAASKALDNSLKIVNFHRKKTGVGRTFFQIMTGADSTKYSEHEAHAELCYAQTMLFKTILTLVEDDSFSNLIKGGLKLNSSYTSFKTCNSILAGRTWESNEIKKHYQSAICMGLGTLTLGISYLPKNVTKFLEYIGFSADQAYAVKLLQQGSQIEDAWGQIFCIVMLLCHYLTISLNLSYKPIDLQSVDLLLMEMKKYPHSLWYQYYKAQSELLRGNLSIAFECFQQTLSTNFCPSFHHLCLWSMLWIHCIKNEWKDASYIVDRVSINEGWWSKIVYNYLKATMLYMLQDNIILDEKDEMMSLMGDVSKTKQKKLVPMDKFAIIRSGQFIDAKELMIPAIEMMFLFHYFKIFEKDSDLANGFHEKIEDSFVKLNKDSKYFFENKAVLLLMKGALLRMASLPAQAMVCLEEVISLRSTLPIGNYYVPQAYVETALLHMAAGDNDNALRVLNQVKSNFSNYLFETRINFIIHSALSELNK